MFPAWDARLSNFVKICLTRSAAVIISSDARKQYGAVSVRYCPLLVVVAVSAVFTMLTVLPVATPAPPPLALVVVIIASPPVRGIHGRRSHYNRSRDIHRLRRNIYRRSHIDWSRFGIDDTGDPNANVYIHVCLGSRRNREQCARQHPKERKLFHMFSIANRQLLCRFALGALVRQL